MTAAPENHLDWAGLVDYWAGDLGADELAAHEEHLFGCEACSQLSAQVAAITEALRGQIPMLLTPSLVAQLHARGLRIVENPMQPGERRAVAFPKSADILLHRLGGLDLETATEVRCELRVESTGESITTVEEAPFDRARGEVLLACQQHFAAYPPDTLAEVRVRAADGGERIATYTILHQW